MPHGERIYRSTICPKCGKPLKICLNCQFYAPGAHFDCHEDIGEPVLEKDLANFCDYFAARPDNSPKNREEGHKKAVAAFKNLFPDD